MRIALDTSCVARDGRTGVAMYAVSLVRHLAAIDQENTYRLCYRLSRLKKWKYFLERPAANFSTRLFQEPLHIPMLGNVDLFHGLDARVITGGRMRKIATLHEAYSLHRDDVATASFNEMKRRNYQEMADECDIIISVSQAAKDGFREAITINDDRVRVVRSGVDPLFQPVAKDEARAWCRERGLERPFILFVGDIRNKLKNAENMVKAFGLLPKATRNGLEFIFSGPADPDDNVRQAIQQSGVEGQVRFIGYHPWEDLPYLYSAAEVFLFTTMYEGFGMPVLEAMACGCPVVTSNVSAHPEVAGDAGILVDPLSPEAISEGLRQMLEDSALHQRYRMVGLERVKFFTWRKTAEETLAIYKELA